MLKDINPGALSSTPGGFRSIGNIASFSADDGIHGREIWKTDGTNAGTEIVKDIIPGNTSSAIINITAIGNKILFSANDNINGEEIWISDGTAANTAMEQNIAPVGGSTPASFVRAGNNVYITAFTEDYDREIWVTDLASLGINLLALPLQFLDFSGRLNNDNALLHWTTRDEVNTSSFEVERSIDGRTYQSIGSVTAFNTPGTHTYQFTDPQVSLLGSKIIYYRLKLRDIDGRATHSRIVAISIDNKNLVMIYPNPAGQTLNLTVTVHKKETVKIEILDQLGRSVRQQSITANAGSNTYAIELTELASGSYHLKLTGETVKETKQFIKK